jgi:hypothetical protein
VNEPEQPGSADEVVEIADPLQRLVAVLIMVVTLIGAGVAFLQTQAGNRESVANRQAEAYAVRTLSSFVTAGRAFGQRDIALDLSNDPSAQSVYLDATAASGGPAAAYAAALSRAYEEVSTSAGADAREVLGYDLAPADFERFYVDQYRPTYAAIEYQKAYARERDGWGGKGSQYVTVITVLAVALFLLGLTLTVPSGARAPFLVMGTAVAPGGGGMGRDDLAPRGGGALAGGRGGLRSGPGKARRRLVRSLRRPGGPRRDRGRHDPGHRGPAGLPGGLPGAW